MYLNFYCTRENITCISISIVHGEKHHIVSQFLLYIHMGKHGKILHVSQFLFCMREYHSISISILHGVNITLYLFCAWGNNI